VRTGIWFRGEYTFCGRVVRGNYIYVYVVYICLGSQAKDVCILPLSCVGKRSAPLRNVSTNAMGGTEGCGLRNYLDLME
jgi:hypothetical protein